METLRAPVNFVETRREMWPEAAAGDIAALDDTVLGARVTDGYTSWMLLSYVMFRRHGLDVTYAPRPVRGAINIVLTRHFGLSTRTRGAFVCAIQADGHPMRISHFDLMQNAVRGAGRTHDWINFWPQIGLLPRDPARGTRIEAVTFKGEPQALDAVFKAEAFRDLLARRGVSLRLGERDAEGRVDWTDYREADLVLALRRSTVAMARGKPASKLTNAWRAGTPALLGPEPAYRELRRSDLDYIEVTSPAEVLAAIDRLQAEPRRYAAMVENGHARAPLYDFESVLGRWVAVLNGPVFEAFHAWERRSPAYKAAWHVASAAMEPLARRLFAYRLRFGRRLYAAPLLPAADLPSEALSSEAEALAVAAGQRVRPG